jgi:cell division transport system permease protein
MSALALRAHALGRALRAAGRQPGTLTLAWLLATLACTVLLAALIAGPSVWSSWQRAQSWRAAEATAFITPGTPATELKAALARAQALPLVSSVRLVERDAALAELAGRGGIALPELKTNPLPDALALRFDAAAAPAQVEATVAALRKLPKIDVVHFDGTWHQRLSTVIGAGLALGAATAAAALLAIALALVSAVRLLTVGDRAEVQVMQLVGATDRAIVRPYAYTGAGLLLLASAGAVGVLALSWRWLQPALTGLPGLDPAWTIPAPPLVVMVGFVLAATLAGLALGALAGRSALAQGVQRRE